MSTQSAVKVVTTHVLSEMKLKGEKISMLTSYDYSMARIVDQAGIDVILVGLQTIDKSRDSVELVLLVYGLVSDYRLASRFAESDLFRHYAAVS